MLTRLHRFLIYSTLTASAALCTLGDVSAARAVSLFSVDVNSDSLVKIDSETGAVSVVGSLQFDATSTDLASFNNRLFILDTVFQNRVDIYEVNPSTAQTVSSAQVLLNGNPVLHGEALTNEGNQLKIGFSSGGNETSSESLGDLSLAGEITNAIETTGDFDGLGGDGVSRFFSVDPPGFGVGPSPVFTVDLTTGSLSSFTTVPRIGNDLVVSGENLFLLDNSLAVTEAFLLTVSTSNGLITDTVSLGNGQYFGLAVVPEPLTILGTATAVGFGAFFKRQINKKKKDTEE